MKLLKSQLDAISNAIRSRLIENARKKFPSKTTAKINSQVKKIRDLQAQQEKLEQTITDLEHAFEKEHKVSVCFWDRSITVEEIFNDILENQVPPLGTIQGEVSLQSAFAETDDANAFIEKVTKAIEKK